MMRYKVALTFFTDAEKDVEIAEKLNEACELIDWMFEPESIVTRWEREEEKEDTP